MRICDDLAGEEEPQLGRPAADTDTSDDTPIPFVPTTNHHPPSLPTGIRFASGRPLSTEHSSFCEDLFLDEMEGLACGSRQRERDFACKNRPSPEQLLDSFYTSTIFSQPAHHRLSKRLALATHSTTTKHGVNGEQNKQTNKQQNMKRGTPNTPAGEKAWNSFFCAHRHSLTQT